MKDHLWIVTLFFIGPIGFFLLYAVLAHFTLDDFLYYFFLEMIILIGSLGWRFYITWDIYEQFCNESKQLQAYFIAEPKCNQEIQYQKLLKRIQAINKTERNTLLNDRKEQKLMMYQWVHQMKTPLSIIKLITENHKGDEEFRKIASSVKQMQYNLDQILSMYQLDAMENDFKAEKIELYQVCKKTIN